MQYGGSTSTVTAGAVDGVVSLANGQHATILPAGMSDTNPPSDVAIDGRTLTPGGPALTSAGATFSAVDPSQLLVVIEGHSSTIAVDAVSSNVVSLDHGHVATVGPVSGGYGSGPLVTTVDGHVITALQSGAVVDGTTITQGGAAKTIEGTVYSINAQGQLVVAGSTTLGQNSLGGLMAAVETAAAAMSGSTATTSSPATTEMSSPRASLTGSSPSGKPGSATSGGASVGRIGPLPAFVGCLLVVLALLLP
jgi:hypothetical protein